MTRSGLVVIAIAVAVAAATSVGVAQAPRPTFDVSSVKRNRSGDFGFSMNGRSDAYVITNATLQAVIRVAYGVRDDQILGGPGWIRTDRFDIVGKMTAGGSPDEHLRLQSLLEDRFMLTVHGERREMPVFMLTLAHRDGRLGPGLQRVDDCQRGRAARTTTAPPGGAAMGGCGSSKAIADSVSRELQATVVDKTGLTGDFERHLFFKPDEVASRPSASSSASPDLPSFPAALQEQWGLKLESGRGPVDVLVIDSVQPPTEN